MVAGVGFEPPTFGLSGCAYFLGRVRSITIGVKSESVRIHWSDRRSRLVRWVSLNTAGLRQHGRQNLRKHGVDRGGVLLLFPFEDVSIHIERNS